jgi:hypothetical protein
MPQNYKIESNDARKIRFLTFWEIFFAAHSSFLFDLRLFFDAEKSDFVVFLQKSTMLIPEWKYPYCPVLQNISSTLTAQAADCNEA